MIEVSAKLVGGPVYVPGESIGCCISFNHPPVPPDTRFRSNRDALETLAWASAQIHCLCSTNGKLLMPSKESVTPEEVSMSSTDTSFAPCRGDKGHIVLSTKPKILFCDLRLSPGESKSYFYSETLPNESPPSFRGQLVKYSYKITIGTQRVGCPIKLLRVPIRVLVICGFPEIFNPCEDTEDLTPSNPFLEKSAKESDQDILVQFMQNITARRSPYFYNVTNAKGRVARFCLFKQAYKLGEDIVGTFDFSTATVPCVQFTVTLQCEEVISEDFRAESKQDKAVSSFSNCHEVCLSLKQCLLNLPIPLHVTPAFSTELVSLQWRLHFEFVTTEPNILSSPDNVQTWQGPSALSVETMIWDLPIQIYPSLPSPEPQTQIKHIHVDSAIDAAYLNT